MKRVGLRGLFRPVSVVVCISAVFLLSDGYAAQKSSPRTVSALNSQARLQFNTVILIQEDILKETDPEKRAELYQEVLEHTKALTKSAPDLVEVWLLRAGAALQLGRWQEGHSAGKELIRLGVLDSESAQASMLLAQLNRRGWLVDDIGKIELREIRKKTKLRLDSELPDAVRAELAQIINKFSAGENWDAYARVKALRLKLGKDQILLYPLARRVLAQTLGVAAARGDVDLVRASLAAEGDPDSSESGYSALYWAGFSGSTDMVRLLLAAGADARKAGKHGKPMLTEPVLKGNVAVVGMLIRGGADANGRHNGVPLLQKAVAKGHAGVVSELIKGGADVQAKALENPTPALYTAIKIQNLEIVKILAAAGIDFEDEYKDRDMWYYAKRSDVDEVYDVMKATIKKRKADAKAKSRAASTN